MKENYDVPVSAALFFADLTNNEIPEFEFPVPQLLEIILHIGVSQDSRSSMAFVPVFVPSIGQGDENRCNACLTFGNASTNPVIYSVFETLPAFSTCGCLAIVQQRW
ncbi:hypothetical protein [Rhizobium sp. CSW-27]|uniref:hypothetical protein n=1 Tax=Rhizobium sp. CSW-27 TaxID=2839985 RepID=UPI001C022BC3|nr:hypothetical protein [Rhizobium sp. CSW-27]MBT9371784.1 hypothetical protein [Rhizobium sp. CSW-27]